MIKVNRTLRNFKGTSLIVGGSHDDLISFKLAENPIPAGNLRPKENYYTTDLRNEPGVDYVGNFCTKGFLEEAKSRFNYVAFERTTEIYSDSTAILTALKNAYNLLKYDGILVLFGYRNEYLSTESKLLLDDLFPFQVIYTYGLLDTKTAIVSKSPIFNLKNNSHLNAIKKNIAQSEPTIEFITPKKTYDSDSPINKSLQKELKYGSHHTISRESFSLLGRYQHRNKNLLNYGLYNKNKDQGNRKERNKIVSEPCQQRCRN